MRPIFQVVRSVVVLALMWPLAGAADAADVVPERHSTVVTASGKPPTDDGFDDVTAYIDSLTLRDVVGLLGPVALACAVIVAVRFASKRR